MPSRAAPSMLLPNEAMCRREGKKEDIVVKQVTCPPCGVVVCAESDDELVVEFQQHAREHGMSLSRDQILAMAADLRTSFTPRVRR